MSKTTTSAWEDPFTIITITVDTVIGQIPRDRPHFRSTCVRPTFNLILARSDPPTNETSPTKMLAPRAMIPHATKPKASRKSGYVGDSYEQSRKQELDGLVDHGIFRRIRQDQVKEGTRIFGSRFTDALKQVSEEKKRK